MATAGWFDTNRARSYPFVRGTVGRPPDGDPTVLNLPHGVVVDAGFLAGPGSGFEPGVHSVRLARVAREGDLFTIEFTSDAPGLEGVPLVFTRLAGDEDYLTEHADSNPRDVTFSVSGSESTLSLSGDEDCREPAWSGYLVTGSVEALDEWMALEGLVEGGAGEGVVEPALVQSLDRGYVVALHLANDDRTRVAGPPECGDDPETWPAPAEDPYVRARCLDGVVLLQGGYNVQLRQRAADNSIVFSAGAGLGLGRPCGEVPVYEGEEPPAGSSLLSGGPACGEVLRSINGVGGRAVDVVGLQGVTVTPLPDEHTLVIDVDMTGLATCAGGSLSDSC